MLQLFLQSIALILGLVATFVLTQKEKVPFFQRLFPESHIKFQAKKRLYRENSLSEGDLGYDEILEIIYQNVDHTDLLFRPNQIELVTALGRGEVVRLRNTKYDSRSGAKRYDVGSHQAVLEWIEAEIRAPVKTFGWIIAALSVLLQISVISM